MNLSILIVTYNSAKLMPPLLEHLAKDIQNLNAEVIVVDNASRDQTADLVRIQFPWVKLIASAENLGFAAGNNLGAQQATGRYLLLLNPDAIPEVGALERGIELMDQHPEAGLAGGELRGMDGSRQPSPHMFHTLRDEFFVMSGLAAKFPDSRIFGRFKRSWANPNQDAIVDWLVGAFIFIPAKLFQELAGFDERFFMYYEEVDLCRRLQKSGMKVYYWPELKALHIGGESAKTVEKQRVSKAGSQLESWRMRSALLYYRKHHGLLGALGLHWLDWGWHRLRQLKAQLSGKRTMSAELMAYCKQLNEAWRDTSAGTQSPARPW